MGRTVIHTVHAQDKKEAYKKSRECYPRCECAKVVDIVHKPFPINNKELNRLDYTAR